jgi:hypothetical protein
MKRLIGGGGTGTVSAAGSGTAAAPGIAFASDPNTGIYNPGADQLAVATNGTGRLFIDASGNVGVGLSNPSYPLEVASSTNSTINITGGTSNSCRLFFSDTALARGFLNYDHADDSINIGTAGSERLRITSAGLVGIGVSAPTGTLHVNSSALNTPLLKLAYTGNSNNTGNILIPIEVAQNTTAGGAVAVTTIKVTDTSTGGPFPSTKTLTGLHVDVSGSTYGVKNAAIFEGGNVGIGTTAPDVSLHVKSAGSSIVSEFEATAAGFSSIDLSNTAGYARLSSVAGNLALSPAGTERLRITSAGLVGIGTSAPQDRLSVNASAANTFAANFFGPLANLNHVLVGLSDDATTKKAGIGFQRVDGFRRGSFFIFNNNDANGSTSGGINDARLTVTSAGLVGIGTASPGVALDVNGNGSFLSSILITNSQTKIGDSGIIDGGAADGNTQINFFSGKSLILKNGGSERARLDSSGRLLVGTSTGLGGIPGQAEQKFQVAGATDGGLSMHTFSADQYACNLEFRKSRSASVGTKTIVQNGDSLGKFYYCGADGTNYIRAAAIEAFVDGTPGTNGMPGRIVLSTTANGSATPTERLRITSAGVLQVADAGNITVGTTTGTKIGTATTQKLGFYNATPVVQPTAVADATDAATAITQLNDLLAKLRTLGVIAT